MQRKAADKQGLRCYENKQEKSVGSIYKMCYNVSHGKIRHGDMPNHVPERTKHDFFMRIFGFALCGRKESDV